MLAMIAFRRAGHLRRLRNPGRSRGGTSCREQAKRLPFADLLATAIKQARDGVEVSRHLALNIADASRELKDVPGFADTFLIDGKPVPQGARLHLSALAETLDHLAHAGLDD